MLTWLGNVTGLAFIFGGNRNEEQIHARLRQYKKQLDRLVEDSNSNPKFKTLVANITKILEGSIMMDLQKLNTKILDTASGSDLQWLKNAFLRGKHRCSNVIVLFFYHF